MSIVPKSSIRILISGAASNDAVPHIITSILDGHIFGPKKSVLFHLYDEASYSEELERMKMDIYDCGYPLLEDIFTTSQLIEAYRDIDIALIMNKVEGEKRDSLEGEYFRYNLKGFKRQAITMNEYANRHCLVIVCVPPVNTICFVINHYATMLSKHNITGVSRIDLNRTKARLSVELGVPATSVTKCVIWGNINREGRTTFPDVTYAQVKQPGQSIPQKQIESISAVLKNDNWVKSQLLTLLQERKLQDTTCPSANGKAIVDHLEDLWKGTEEDNWTSMVVYSRGEYDIPRDLFFSFPVIIKKNRWFIVNNLAISEWARAKISESCKEIELERKLAITECG